MNSNGELDTLARQLAEQRLPPGWDVVASSVNARVAHSAERGIYYKEFLPRSPLERLKALLRGSRAHRARRNSDRLVRAGFDAPANLAWGALPGGREYLFTAAVEGEGVTEWLRKVLAGADVPTLRRRRRLLRELGKYIGRLHATGFIHGDLRTGNVLAMETADGFRFALIDNERTIQRKPPPGKLLLKNLMQLNMLTPGELSRTDRWRFFTAWHRQMRDLSGLEARLLAVEAHAWAMRRLGAKGKL